MFHKAALVGLALVTLGQAAGIPDPTYPANGPPWNPPNIVPSAVNQVCRPQSGSSNPGPGSATFVHKPGGKTGSGIIITLGDCPPPVGGNVVKRTQEQLARDVQFYEQFLGDTDFDVAGTLGLDPAHRLPPRNDNPEYVTPWRPSGPAALEPQSHSKRQQCTFPTNDCRFLPGGASLQGYSRCTFNCQAICVIDGGGPKAEDCQHIFDNFRNSPMHSNEHVAFSIPQDKFVMYTYGTCATTIHNHIPKAHLDQNGNCPRADLIFSYPNWAASGDSLVVSCREKAQNGICRDNTPVGVDFYMQMYRFEQV